MLTAAQREATLLDAIYPGLIQMRDATSRKRALLVISDGGDNHSRYNERDIQRS
jgi:Ca-activated chloride channel homolog